MHIALDESLSVPVLSVASLLHIFMRWVYYYTWERITSKVGAKTAGLIFARYASNANHKIKNKYPQTKYVKCCVIYIPNGNFANHPTEGADTRQSWSTKERVHCAREQKRKTETASINKKLLLLNGWSLLVAVRVRRVQSQPTQIIHTQLAHSELGNKISRTISFYFIFSFRLGFFIFHFFFHLFEIVWFVDGFSSYFSWLDARSHSLSLARSHPIRFGTLCVVCTS